MKVSIDFESRSAVDIWEAGAWVYSRHPSTSVMCICFAVDDGPVETVTFPELEKDLKAPSFSSLGLSRLKALANKPDVTFHAFNAFFEQCIWKNIMVRDYGMPEIPIHRWRGTEAKSNAFGLPKSLANVALALNLTQLKDRAGKQVMMKLAKPKPNRKNDPFLQFYAPTEDEIKALYEYCAQDVVVEREIDKALPDLLPAEQEVWFLDQLINMRGVNTDMAFVSSVRKLLFHHNTRLNAELNSLTNGGVGKGTEVAAMVRYLQSKGVQIEDLKKDTVSSLIKGGKLDAHCLQVLRYRVELGKSSNAKYEKLATSTDTDGRVRDCFIYHGASTGRWTGKLVQLQNLPKLDGSVDVPDFIGNTKTQDYATMRFLYGDTINKCASSSIRGAFTPSEGNELNVVDYAAIEARCVFWLAGEEVGLREFAESDSGSGPEIYVRMAQRIYADERLTKANKPERNLGKTAILGLGFQMGHKRFIETCSAWGVFLPEHLYSITKETDQDGKVVEKHHCIVVDQYRNHYSRVVQFWYDTERAAIHAVLHPGEMSPCGKTAWVYNKQRDFLFCRLPSGRFLTYMSPRIEQEGRGPKLTHMAEKDFQWVRSATYGGKLVENITQATARDLMAYSMVRLEKAKMPVVMHTHDEIVTDVPKGSGLLESMTKIMCEVPAWAEGLPIKAEGFTAERYEKR